MVVTKPNEVWSTDITYSNTQDTSFCVGRLEEALQRYGKPEIFNTDQGCQFTTDSFTGLLNAHGIAISMDGCCRALDNIFVERLWCSMKFEVVYLKGHANPMELRIGLTEYFVFYKDEWPHQSLGNCTPAVVYSTASGGGAWIVDKFRKNETASSSCVKDAHLCKGRTENLKLD